MDKDFDPFDGTVNPDPYPYHGTPDAQQAWWAKDRGLKSGKKTTRAPLPLQKNAREDAFDLPTMPLPIGNYPEDGTLDERQVWVQRASVACANAGISEFNKAIEYHWLKLVEESQAQAILKLKSENVDLTTRLHKAERTFIDDAVRKIFDQVRLYIVEQFGRERSVLERRVMAITTNSEDYDLPSLDVLNAKAVLLDRRLSELEQSAGSN